MDVLDALLMHPIHEARLLGVVLSAGMDETAKGAPEMRDGIGAVIVDRAGHLDNGDLVNTAAPCTLGPRLLHQPQGRQDAMLDKLAASPPLGPVVGQRRSCTARPSLIFAPAGASPSA